MAAPTAGTSMLGARGAHQSVVTAAGRDRAFRPVRLCVHLEDEAGVVRERSSELGRERHAVEIDAGVGEQRQAAVIGFKRGAGTHGPSRSASLSMIAPAFVAGPDTPT